MGMGCAALVFYVEIECTDHRRGCDGARAWYEEGVEWGGAERLGFGPLVFPNILSAQRLPVSEKDTLNLILNLAVLVFVLDSHSVSVILGNLQQ